MQFNTVNKVADHIAGLLGQPFNEVLKDQVRFTLGYYRAEFLKQTLSRNYIDRQYFQTFITPLVKVDKADTCYVEIGCIILRTEKQLPETIRTGTVPFKFAGTVGRKASFAYTDFEVVQYAKGNRYTKNIFRYSLRNNFGYVFGNTKLKFAEWEALLVDPYMANMCQDDCMNDDKPYPMPTDMLRAVVNGIITGEYRLMQKDDQEAKLEEPKT